MAWAPEDATNADLVGDPARFVDHYLRTINDLFQAQNDSADRVRFTKFAAQPARPEKGAAYYADGTNWNPGNGEGIYLYNNAGVFVFLGPANLTGPITSVGGATSVASQTGTGSTFVMQTSPTLITPNIGNATGTTLATTSNITSGNLVQAGGTGGTGAIGIVNGGTGNSGYAQFLSTTGARQGYIGFSATNVATDTGNLSYVAGTHTFAGTIITSTINAPGGLTFQAAGTIYGQLATGGTWCFGGAFGSESLRVPPIAGAVNFFQMNGAAAGNAVQMYSNGASANIGIDYLAKGSAFHTFYNNGTPSFQISTVASGVNYHFFAPSATGSPLVWLAAGSDATINMLIQPKGTGALKVDCGASGSSVQLQVNSTGGQGATSSSAASAVCAPAFRA